MAEDTEETIYDKAGRSELSDDEEISPEEEAFMQGYDEADEDAEPKPDDDDEVKDKDEE